MIVNFKQFQDRLLYLWKAGWKKGRSTGFTGLDNYYTIIKGVMTFYGGYSAHGKSQFVLNILRNLKELHNWRHLIFSPEHDIEELMITLLELHSGKRFSETENQYDERISIAEMYRYLEEIHEYYLFIDLKPEELYIEKMLEIIKSECVTINYDTVTIDPWNELRHDLTKFGGRQDLYLEHWLTMLRRFAKDTDIHLNIVAHPKTDRIRNTGTYRAAPSLYDFTGGDVWANKAQNVIIVYRPSTDNEGNEYPKHNQSEIYIRKVKPRRLGRQGQVTMWYDVECGSFYEKDGTGQRIFENAKI